MLLGIEKANPERRVTRPLSRASAWSRKCFKRSVDRRSKNVNWRASIETFVRFLEIEGQGNRKTPIEIVDVGWERDSVSDELLEGAPESLESRGGVPIVLDTSSKKRSHAIDGFREDALELRAEVGDDVLRFLKRGDGSLEEGSHGGGARSFRISLENQWRSGMRVENPAEPQVAAVAECMKRREIEHPGVMNEAGNHGIGWRFGIDAIKNVVGRAYERLGADAFDGSLGDFPSRAGHECSHHECATELGAVHGLNKSAGDVGDASDRGHRLDEGADGFGLLIGLAFPVGDHAGRDRKLFGGDDAVPSRHASELKDLESLMRFIVRSIDARNTKPAKSKKFCGSFGEKGALFGGLELGGELSDFRRSISPLSSVSRGSFGEEFRGHEHGSLGDAFGLGIEASFANEAESRTRGEVVEHCGDHSCGSAVVPRWALASSAGCFAGKRPCRVNR